MNSSGKRPETGREYRRVSRQKYTGELRSTSEQAEDNQVDAEGQGVVLGVPYVDDSRSASRYARRQRDDFNELMADLRSGSFGADVLWLWESSRGSRKVGEWVDLIELCERAGVVIRVTTHGRFYDPRNERDRRTLLEDAVDSEYESSKTAKRCQRAAASSARAGKPYGRVPYGFQRRYDEHTRKLVAQEPHPVESKVVKRMFTLFLRGVSLRDIARRLAADGIRNRSGRAFTAQHVRTMLLNPAYAGLRAHAAGNPYGWRRATLGDTNITDGLWKGLVSRQRFWEARQKLTDPSRVTCRTSRAKHLLSIIGRCGVCGAGITVIYREKLRYYRCQAGDACVMIRADELDDHVVSEIHAYLSRSDVWEAMQEQSGRDIAELVEARGDVAALLAQLDELADAVANRQVTVKFAARTEPQLLAELSTAEKRERELSTPNVLRGVLDPAVSVAEQWQDIPTTARRELARALLVPSMMGTVLVHRRPPGRGGRARVPACERVTFDTSESVAA